MRQYIVTLLLILAALFGERLEAQGLLPPSRKAHVVFQANCNNDADGDGTADGLVGSGGGFQLQAAPHGRCQQVKVPEKASPGWFSGLRTQPIPVKTGERYVVRFECKAQGVQTFHVKLRWLDAQGKTVVRSVNKQQIHYDQLCAPVRPWRRDSWWDPDEWRAGLPSGSWDGTWDWAEWTSTYPAPPGAVNARLEFWARQEGGTFWIDGISVVRIVPVQFSLKCIAIHEQHTENNDEGRGTDSPRREPVRLRFPIRKPDKPIDSQSLAPQEIVLSNAVRIGLVRAGADFWGLGRVLVGGVVLRRGEFPIAPLFTGGEPIAYRSCRLKAVDRQGVRWVLRTMLVSDDGSTDSLDWLVEPFCAEVEGKDLVGFRYAYRWRSKVRKVREVLDRSSWCLGSAGGDASVAGLRLLEQWGFTAAMPPVTDFNEYKPLCVTLPTKARIGKGDFVDFLTAQDVSLVSWVDDVALSFKRFFRVPPMRELVLEERFVTALRGECTTPWRVVAVYRAGGLDAWTFARDFVAERLCRRIDIMPSEFLPTTQISKNLYLVYPREANFDWVRKQLPFAAALGFKRVNIGPIWKSTATEQEVLKGKGKKKGIRRGSSCAPLSLEVAARLGGEEGLRRLCDEAHRLGVQVIAWTPTAHLSVLSPLLEEHPEWIVRNRDGSPYDLGYRQDGHSSLVGVFHPAGYTQYALARLRQTRQRTGLDGIWFDSYPSFGLRAYNYATPDWAPQFDAVLDFHRAMRKLGYFVLVEGHVPFDIPSDGFGGMVEPYPFVRYWQGREWLLYKTAPWWLPLDTSVKPPSEALGWRKLKPPPQPGFYFRLLANKCTPMISLEVFQQDAAIREEALYANNAYGRLSPLMKRRRLLQRNGSMVGVLWEDQTRGRGALWAFTDGWLDVGFPVKKASEISTEQSAPVRGSHVLCTQWRAYALSW